MKRHKVREVSFSNRARAFRVRISRRDDDYVVPYSMAGVDGLVDSVAPDTEIGNDGFTWITRDGGEGTLLAEQVLWLHHDPEVRLRHTLYELSIEARRRKQELNISTRTLAGMLRTSPARVHALLDPTISRGKTINAMAKLLSALGARVDVSVSDREAAR